MQEISHKPYEVGQVQTQKSLPSKFAKLIKRLRKRFHKKEKIKSETRKSVIELLNDVENKATHKISETISSIKFSITSEQGRQGSKRRTNLYWVCATCCSSSLQELQLHNSRVDSARSSILQRLDCRRSHLGNLPPNCSSFCSQGHTTLWSPRAASPSPALQ